MKADRQRWRWSVACVFAVVGFFLFLTLNESWWQRLGVLHMRPYFSDTVAILAAGDAERAGLDVYQPNPFDPYNRPHVYGEWWLVVGHLGLTRGDAWWLGSLLGLAFVAVAVASIGPRTASEATLTVLLLLSPPVLLGVERGNNDLVIFLLLVSAAAVLAGDRTRNAMLGGGVVVLAGALKFYPLAALAAMLARRERAVRSFGWAAGAMALFAVLGWGQRESFARAIANAPSLETLFAYGLRVSLASWWHDGGARAWLGAGFLGGLGLAGAVIWPGRGAIVRAFPAEGRVAGLAAAGAATWLFCYAVGSNFSYRAVLLLLIVPAWMELGRSAEPPARWLGRAMVSLLALTLWSFWVKALAFDRMGETVAGRLAFWNSTMAVCGIEQALMFALSVVIAASLAGWLWRRGWMRLRYGDNGSPSAR